MQANIAIAPSAPKTCSPLSGQKRSRNFIDRTTLAKLGQIATDDPRPGLAIGGGDLPVVRLIRKIRRFVYFASIVCWKSTDGGKTWDGWRGAPGGDDYQNVWINPNNPGIILLAATRAQSSLSTAARPGARGITSRQRSCIM